MTPDTATWIEPVDLFGLGCMRWRDQVLRECLTDQARLDAFDRSTVAVRLKGRGCQRSCLAIEVAQDAAGRWWAGWYWSCWHVPDGAACGVNTPIDAYRGATRQAAIAAAAAGLLKTLPGLTSGKAGRIMQGWRAELAEIVERADA